MVLAGDKEQLTLAFLQVAGEGNDPMIIPRALDKKSGGKVLDKVERFQVGGLPAARLVFQAKTKHGLMGVDLNWIAYQGVIYQIVGISPQKTYEKYASTFRQMVKSFRPLTRTERTSFSITRLRLAPARQGETLQGFITRTDCIWTEAEVAAANGIQTNAVLKDGQLLKIAKRERYLP
jgi:predicted Zn-dependent protease